MDFEADAGCSVMGRRRLLDANPPVQCFARLSREAVLPVVEALPSEGAAQHFLSSVLVAAPWAHEVES